MGAIKGVQNGYQVAAKKSMTFSSFSVAPFYLSKKEICRATEKKEKTERNGRGILTLNNTACVEVLAHVCGGVFVCLRAHIIAL